MKRPTFMKIEDIQQRIETIEGIIWKDLKLKYVYVSVWCVCMCVCVCVCVCVLSCVTLCDTKDGSPPGSLSIEFPRQEYWSGLPFPTPGDLPNPGIKPTSLVPPALAGRFFTTVTHDTCIYIYIYIWKYIF